MARLKLAYLAAGAATVTIHVAAFGGLNAMKKPDPAKHMVAVMVSAPKPKKAKPEPPKPVEAPKEMLERPTAARRPAAPAPAPAPAPDPVAAAHPALAALPDFGISMNGGPGGGGIAVPMGGAAPPPQAEAPKKEKVFGSTGEKPAAAGDGCDEDLVKAKAQGFVKPTYSDDARAAGIEGRVRVEISIDETGHVVSAKIVSGLGHGLDESAIDAAKRMTFTPATKCGTAVKSTFLISIRFGLGD
jgi:protein TonB